MKNFIRLMKAMFDPNSVRIIKLLQRKELCVCELTELPGLAQSTVSKHLKLLDDAELIESRLDGAWIIYRIKIESDTTYARCIPEKMNDWHDGDALLIEMIKRLPFIDRGRIIAA